jgi:hypothetical protein
MRIEAAVSKEKIFHSLNRHDINHVQRERRNDDTKLKKNVRVNRKTMTS